MVYKPLNPNLPNLRETPQFKKRRIENLETGRRYEFYKSMFGNVHTILDHKRKVYYRQDMKIIEQLDLLDEPLPRYCDFCEKVVDEIIQVKYTAVYEMIVRPYVDPEIKRDSRKIVFSSCNKCKRKNIVPERILSGYIVELYREGSLIWKRPFLHYNGEIKMPWTAI